MTTHDPTIQVVQIMTLQLYHITDAAAAAAASADGTYWKRETQPITFFRPFCNEAPFCANCV